MVFVKLKASHPSSYVKVRAGSNIARVTKRGSEFPDEWAEFFVGDSLIVEGVVKAPVNKVVVEDKSVESVEAPKKKIKKGIFNK